MLVFKRINWRSESNTSKTYKGLSFTMWSEY